eukprot:2764871-Rhodomonas_salina.2
METIPGCLSRRCFLARVPGGNSTIPDCASTSVSDRRTARWTVICPYSRKPTPSELRSNSLLVFGKKYCTWTMKHLLWQSSGQWQKRPGCMCTGGAGASLWAAGPRDADRTARLSSVVHEYVAPETEEDWFQSTNARSALLTPFFHFTEARGYLDCDHVLAATDGSVKRSDKTMGAGFVFAATNDAAHQGSHCCAVGGDLSSLRAEAVALDLLLDNTASDRT